jgi:peptide deformylase
MALRNMREIGDEILLKRSKEVKKISRRDLNLIEDMLDTMYEKEGLGLAAPQVGVLKRIVVIHGAATIKEDSGKESEIAGEVDTKAREETTKGDDFRTREETTETDDISTHEESTKKGDSTNQEESCEPTDDIEEIDPIILINPVIIMEEGSQTGEEGCLSVPGKWGIVSRPGKVKIKACDVNMEEFELEAEELLARAICHEIDHLDGKLYVDLVEGELRDADDRDDEGDKQ